MGETLPRDKTLGLDPAIRLYAIEDSGYTEKVEEAEILVFCNSSLESSKKNLVKSKFPYIDTFDHEGPAFISGMRDITVGVFDCLNITSPMDVYKRLACMQRILRGAVLKKFR